MQPALQIVILESWFALDIFSSFSQTYNYISRSCRRSSPSQLIIIIRSVPAFSSSCYHVLCVVTTVLVARQRVDEILELLLKNRRDVRMICDSGRDRDVWNGHVRKVMVEGERDVFIIVFTLTSLSLSSAMTLACVSCSSWSLTSSVASCSFATADLYLETCQGQIRDMLLESSPFWIRSRLEL